MLVGLALCCCAPFAVAQRRVCSTGNIPISADNRTDLFQACLAISESRTFLTSLGLKPPTGVAIHIVGDLMRKDGTEHELAYYDGHQCAIHMLDFATARAQVGQGDIQGLKVAMNRPLWRSYVVHELTHAAIHAACGQACPDRAAHEYIAAVAQLSSLPGAVRAEILRGHGNLEGFAEPAEISEIYYALNPSRFMVKSYLHYRRPGNGHQFIKSLLKPASVRPTPAYAHIPSHIPSHGHGLETKGENQSITPE